MVCCLRQNLALQFNACCGLLWCKSEIENWIAEIPPLSSELLTGLFLPVFPDCHLFYFTVLALLFYLHFKAVENRYYLQLSLSYQDALALCLYNCLISALVWIHLAACISGCKHQLAWHIYDPLIVCIKITIVLDVLMTLPQMFHIPHNWGDENAFNQINIGFFYLHIE